LESCYGLSALQTTEQSRVQVWGEEIMEPLLVYAAMALVISIITIKEDRLNKKIAQGFKINTVDRDKDGLVQEGTKWERKAKR
jgi:hypothetical protein